MLISLCLQRWHADPSKHGFGVDLCFPVVRWVINICLKTTYLITKQRQCLERTAQAVPLTVSGIRRPWLYATPSQICTRRSSKDLSRSGRAIGTPSHASIWSICSRSQGCLTSIVLGMWQASSWAWHMVQGWHWRVPSSYEWQMRWSWHGRRLLFRAHI